jgi:hypothetical protein
MKLILSLVILIFSSLSFSDGIYVRKTVADAGISTADAEKVRDVLRKAVTDQGHKLVTTPGQAQWSIRALVSKSDNGPYIVKVERVHSGKLVGTNHGSDLKLDEATRLATTNLVEAMGKVIPEKTTVASSDVAPAAETPATTTEFTEHREVAAAAPTNDASTVEAKHPNYIKNWVVSIGPVISNGLAPTSGTSGTKFAITLGYTFGLSEHWNLEYFYDGNFNTVATGSVYESTFNVGAQYYLSDRLSDFSPWFKIDIGYGGGNRNFDATEVAGGSIGVDFARTQNSTYTVYVRNMTMYSSNGSSLANWPNLTQVMVGINF